MINSQERKIALVESIVVASLWILAFASPLCFGDGLGGNLRAVYSLWARLSIIFVAFVANRLLFMPHMFLRKRYALYTISVVALLLAIYIFVDRFDGVRYIVNLVSSPESAPLRQRHRMPQSIIPPSVTIVAISAIIMGLDMGLKIAVKWVIAEQRQAKLETESVSTQLASLQSQVSPHCFMNTLNNIYALVKAGSPKALDTIMELSHLMEYLLYDSSRSKSVSLLREFEFLENYVSLMRLRYPERVAIEFRYSKDIPNVELPPLLLLNFIENAFKYGVDYSKESFIVIDLEVSGDSIEMRVVNSNHSDTVRCNRRGLGIANSRRRLELIYGKRYTLEICDTPERYCVTLKLPVRL